MWAAEARENMKGRVLVVSDNLPAAIGVRRKLLPLQYRVHVAGRADDALSLLHTQRTGRSWSTLHFRTPMCSGCTSVSRHVIPS